MPQSVRLGRPSQAVSRHQATASREHQLGLILQQRERERGEVGTVGLSLRQGASNNTPEAAEERREETGEEDRSQGPVSQSQSEAPRPPPPQ